MHTKETVVVEYLAYVQKKAYGELGIDPISRRPAKNDPLTFLFEEMHNLPEERAREFAALASNAIGLEIDDPGMPLEEWSRRLRSRVREMSAKDVNERVIKGMEDAGWGEAEIEAQDYSYETKEGLPPTPYEDRDDYKLITQVSQSVLDTMGKVDRYKEAVAPAKKVFFGTVPIGDVNSRVIKVPEGDAFLALFNNGLFRFAYLIGKVLSQALEYPDDGTSFSIPTDPVEDIVSSHPEMVRRFRHLLGAFVISGHPGFSRPYVIGAPPSYLASRQAKCMLAFLVGHEYGHVIAGDLDPALAVHTSILAANVDEITFSHQKEYMADFTGIDLMALAMRAERQPQPLIEWASPLLLLGLHIVRNTYEVLETGEQQEDPESVTHPKTPNRLHALLEPLYDPNRTNLADMRERTEWLIKLFSLLWNEVRPFFEEGHRLRVAPAAIWQDDLRATGRGPKAAVYNDEARVNSTTCDGLTDGVVALQIGDYIWKAGDRHAATATWRRAADLGMTAAQRRLTAAKTFDSSQPDEVVLEA